MKHIKLLFIIPAILIGLSTLPASQVRAQGNAGLTLIPPKYELFANPGDVITETIRLRNNSTDPITFAVLLEDFSSAGEEGKVVLEEGETEQNYSLKDWIEPSSKNVFLQPEEEITFPFSIVVPNDAEPGGHYASLIFQIGGDETVGGVTSVQHRVGSLILLRVSGNVVEDAQIESFSAPTYSQKGPVSFDLRVKNNGTTHVMPNGTIVITNIFGKKVEEIPLDGANVFPGAIRKMTTEWDKQSLLGIYTATVVATYGQQSLPLTSAVKFTVFSPVMAILLSVGLVAGLVFLLSIISGRSRLLKALKIIATGK